MIESDVKEDVTYSAGRKKASSYYGRVLPALSFLLLTVLYVLIAWNFSRYHSFWSPDCGVRFAMIRNYLEHHSLVHIYNPYISQDPEGKCHPLGSFLVHVPWGNCTIYPPLFIYLSVLPYRLFGFMGLCIIPLLAGLLGVYITYKTGKEMGLRFAVGIPLLMGLATPVIIYSVVFWDHSIQMMLCAAAIFALWRSIKSSSFGYAALAGLAFGTGVWFNEVVLALVAALTLTSIPLLKSSSVRRSILGLYFGVIPPVLSWLAFNKMVYGSLSGPHLMGPNSLLDIYRVQHVFNPFLLFQRMLFHIFFQTSSGVLSDTFLLVILSCFMLRWMGEAGRRIAPALWLIAAGLSMALIWHEVGCSAFLEATPFFLIALTSYTKQSSGNRTNKEDTLGMFCSWLGRACLFCCVVISVDPLDPGLHWGCRFLMIIQPAMVLLVLYAVQTQLADLSRHRYRMVAGSMIILIGASLFSQASGLYHVRNDLKYSRDIVNDASMRTSATVVTDIWWLGIEASASSLYPRCVYISKDSKDYPHFIDVMKKKNEKRFDYIGSKEGLVTVTDLLENANIPYVAKNGEMRGGQALYQLERTYVQPIPAKPILSSNNVTNHVMALYYPWYGTPEFTGSWLHQEAEGRTGAPMRTHVHAPINGPYDSCDPNLIRHHLMLCKQAGIDTLVCSWWGKTDPTDRAIRILLNCAKEQEVKVCILWERPANPENPDAIREELAYLLQTYSNESAYLHINNKPMLFLYESVCRSLPEKDWRSILQANPVLTVGCANTMDGVSLWDGLFSLAVPSQTISEERLCRASYIAARRSGKLAIETVMPGYDDIKTNWLVNKEKGFALDRKNGGLYKMLWFQVFRDKPDWVLINSFNQWHTGSEIEPSKEMGESYLKMTGDFVRRLYGK